jgi:hypothetical protein
MVVEALSGRNPLREPAVDAYLRLAQGDDLLQSASSQAMELNACLRRCLAYDPPDRVPLVATMQKELIPLLRGLPPPSPSRTFDAP